MLLLHLSEEKGIHMRQTVFDMKFAKVYPLLVQKAERKGRTRAEVDDITAWLTGYSSSQIDQALSSDLSYGEFL